MSSQVENIHINITSPSSSQPPNMTRSSLSKSQFLTTKLSEFFVCRYLAERLSPSSEGGNVSAFKGPDRRTTNAEPGVVISQRG